MAERELEQIHIRDLTCRCIVGINPEERTNLQDVRINVTLHADLTQACLSDRIEDTVDYKSVKRSILALVETSDCYLIERLAQRIADVCLEHPLVQAVRVTLDKPGALRFAQSVAVDIFRRKPE
ncbi:MAG: dihydroneopterin aldolase [Candidatus Hydrogenedentes bacterium]|nr:dihydroneopterin aldolase [Candidatus Hydrogenedentota bacterium]